MSFPPCSFSPPVLVIDVFFVVFFVLNWKHSTLLNWMNGGRDESIGIGVT